MRDALRPCQCTLNEAEDVWVTYVESWRSARLFIALERALTNEMVVAEDAGSDIEVAPTLHRIAHPTLSAAARTTLYPQLPVVVRVSVVAWW